LDILPLLSSFALIALAELGDKTQLAVIMLSAQHSAISVFSGALLAFLLVNGISVLTGSILISFLPLKWITLASGLVFILFGLLELIRKEKEKTKIEKRHSTLFTAFSFVSLMELGDKTQIASIALAMQFSSPAIVFGGIMLAFILVTGIGVILGSRFIRLLPVKYLRIGTAALFIIFGVIFIINFITGSSVF